jgi:hypothetical protein
LKRLYKAHETIADIGDRIQKLYESATSISPFYSDMPKSNSHNPKSFENIVCEMADLRTRGVMLLKQRARFDVFVCNLNPFYLSLLNMRCEQSLSWGEISRILHISIITGKRIFQKVCDEAEKQGVFDPDEPP